MARKPQYRFLSLLTAKVKLQVSPHCHVAVKCCTNNLFFMHHFLFQLLLENLNGHYAKGLLHYDRDAEAFPVLGEASKMLQNLLTECVYCQPPDCQNRSHILKDMLHIIDQTIIQS